MMTSKMAAFPAAILALTATLVGFGMVAADQDTSKLQVHIPQSLSKLGGYAHREALFGVPPYGGSIQQNVYYADSKLCDAFVDTQIGYPARPVGKDGKMQPWKAPYILMVDRGECTFVQKVRNAQRSGAAGVIIADDSCLCTAGDSCISEPGRDCEAREPIMADDGSGSDISIPSFLMYKQDADPIREELKKNHPVRMEMAWALPHPDNRVEYQLWATPTDPISHEFLMHFKEAAVALGDRAFFTPHMYIYDGINAGCQGATGENMCFNLCTNNGRYCATDPDSDLQRGISGADVVTESLRRLCIWQVYGAQDGVGVIWWNYIAEFLFRCSNSEDYFSNDKCIKDAYDWSGVDATKIDDCMANSGGLSVDGTNSLLDAELKQRDEAGIVILPAAYVNKAAIRGELGFSTIFKAICAGYSAGTEPDVCKQCANCQNEYKCVVQGGCPGATDSSGVSWPVFMISLGVLFAFFLVVGCIQHRRSQNQVRSQVRGLVAEYMPLDMNNKVESATEEKGEMT